MLSKPHYCSHVILPEKTEWKKERQIDFFFKNPLNPSMWPWYDGPKVVALYFSKVALDKKNCIENQYRVTLGAGRLSKQHFAAQKVSKFLAIEMKLEKRTRISACETTSTTSPRKLYEKTELFKNTLQTEEIENAGFSFSCERKTFWERRFLKTMRHCIENQCRVTLSAGRLSK